MINVSDALFFLLAFSIGPPLGRAVVELVSTCCKYLMG